MTITELALWEKTGGRSGHYRREEALDEIASWLRAIIDEHGPRAVALYRGNGLSVSSNGNQIAQAWMAGIGSEMDFSSLTIDQPSKIIAVRRHGVWGGGAVSVLGRFR